MKKLLTLLLLTISALSFGQTWNPYTLQWSTNSSNPNDSIRYMYPGKPGGFSYINSNAQNRKDLPYFKPSGLVNDGNRTTHTGTLNTTALQNAINSGTGKTLVIDGKYATAPLNITTSNITILLTPGSALIGTSALDVNDRLLRISGGASNVTIIGYGAYIDNAAFGSGEQRHNVYINDASNVRIYGLTSLSGGGDCFYIGNNTSTLPTNITLTDCVGDGARRNGLSIANGNTILIDRCLFKNASGTLPKAGIDIEPNTGTDEQLKNIRIINTTTQNNTGHGILVALGAFETSGAKSIDVYIAGHNSIGDGQDGQRGGFSVTGTGYSYAWTNKISGQIQYTRGVIKNSGGSGFYLNSMDPAYAPLVKADMYVENAGTTASSNIDKCGATIFSGAGSNFTNGNLDLNIKVADTRGSPVHYTGVYFYNSVSDISNVNVALDWDGVGSVGTGTIQSVSPRSFAGNIRYINNQVYTHSSAASAFNILSESGGTTLMTGGSTATLPSYATMIGQIITLKNGSSGNTPFNITPATGENIPNVWTGNPTGTIAMSLYGDQIKLLATPSGWQIIDRQFKPRAIFTGTAATNDVFYGTAAPTDGTWTRGAIIRNSNGTAGQIANWYCVAAGTPGTWVAGGVISPATLTGFAAGDFTYTVSSWDKYYTSSGTISSDMTITLSGTGANTGNRIKILRNDAGAGLIHVVNGPTSGNLYDIKAGSSAEFIFSSGNWAKIDNTSQFSGAVTGGSIAWPGTLYTTPTTGTVSSGTLTFTPALATQSANTHLAGPSSGSAASPTFRTMVAADLTSAGIGLTNSGFQVQLGTPSLTNNRIVNFADKAGTIALTSDLQDPTVNTNNLLVATVTGIDAKTTGFTTLYTVPTGKIFVCTQVYLYATTATAITVGPSFDLGDNVGGTGSILNTTTTGLITTTKVYRGAPIGLYAIVTAGNTVRLNITTAATGTTETLTAVLEGFLK